MNPLNQFQQTLTSPAPIPAAYAPTNTLPAVPAAYQGYLNSQAGFAPNAIGANVTTANANTRDINSANASAQRLQDLKDQLSKVQDLADPSKFQQVKKADGGYDFRDPAGKPITLAQYASVVGKRPDQILAESTNTKDVQYVNDWNNYGALHQALQSNDQNALQKIAIQIWGDNRNSNSLSDNEKKKQEQINNAAVARVQQLKSVKPEDLMKAFTTYYSNIYSNLPWNKLPAGTSQTHDAHQIPGINNQGGIDLGLLR